MLFPILAATAGCAGTDTMSRSTRRDPSIPVVTKMPRPSDRAKAEKIEEMEQNQVGLAKVEGNVVR